MPILRKDGRGILFIHVPKTGGSSLDQLFRDDGWRMSYHDGRVGKGSVNHYRWCTPQHMHGEMLRQNFRIDKFDAVFMVVRDPIARFRSEYAWRNGPDVDPSASAVDAWANKVLDTYRSHPFVMGNHIRPQFEFLVPGCEVFKVEDGLESVMRTLNGKYEFDLPLQVGRARTSEKTAGVSSRDVEISPELEARLREFYSLDFTCFDYV